MSVAKVIIVYGACINDIYFHKKQAILIIIHPLWRELFDLKQRWSYLFVWMQRLAWQRRVEWA